MSKCEYYDSKNKECNSPGNPAGIRTNSGVNASRCEFHADKCRLNGANRAIGKCEYYDSKNKECNSLENPAGIGTNSGVNSSTCEFHADKCKFNLRNLVNSKGRINVNCNTIDSCPYCNNRLNSKGRCSECGRYF